MYLIACVYVYVCLFASNRSEGHPPDDDFLVLLPDEGAGATGFLGVQLQLYLLHLRDLLSRRLEYLKNQSG